MVINALQSEEIAKALGNSNKTFEKILRFINKDCVLFFASKFCKINCRISKYGVLK